MANFFSLDPPRPYRKDRAVTANGPPVQQNSPWVSSPASEVAPVQPSPAVCSGASSSSWEWGNSEANVTAPAQQSPAGPWGGMSVPAHQSPQVQQSPTSPAVKPAACSWHGAGNNLDIPPYVNGFTGADIHAKLQSHCSHVEKHLLRNNFYIQANDQWNNWLTMNCSKLTLSTSAYPRTSGRHSLWMGLQCNQCQERVMCQAALDEVRTERDLRMFMSAP